MKLFRNNKGVELTEIGKDASKAKIKNFMAPIGPNGMPLTSETMSVGHKSHTLYPKIPFDEPRYVPEFEKAGLKNTHVVDFPGMFESRGPELEITISLTL